MLDADVMVKETTELVNPASGGDGFRRFAVANEYTLPRSSGRIGEVQELFSVCAGGRVSGYEFCPASDCTALVRSTPTYLRGRR